MIKLRTGIQEKLDDYKANNNSDIFNIISGAIQLVYEKNSKNPDIKLSESITYDLTVMYINGCCRIGNTEEVNPDKLSKFNNIKEDDPNLTYSVYLFLDTVFSS